MTELLRSAGKGARLALLGLLGLLVLATSAPLLASSLPFLWKAPGIGLGSPWLAGLFDENLYESSVDRAFNALLLLGPLTWIAWTSLRHRLARAGVKLGLGLALAVLLLPQIAGTSRAPLDYAALAKAPGAFAIFPPLAQGPRDVDLLAVRAPPSLQHPLGTDNAGRDVAVRLLYGARISLVVGLFSVGLYVLLGTFLGAIAGYLGGRVDLLIGRLIEVVLSIPSLFLILTAAAFIEHRSIFHVLGIIALVQWTTPARLVRAELLRLRKTPLVDAARALGFSEPHILFRELLPNAITPVLVSATFGVGSAILIESTMSFLGLGDITVPSWGQILNTGRTTGAWPMILGPGAAIFFTVGLLNVLGDGIRDALDPHRVGPQPPRAPILPVPLERSSAALLAVRGLEVTIHDLPVVRGLDLTVMPEEAVGLVGESGSGKTMAALSILGLLPDPPARVRRGRIDYQGADLLGLPAAALPAIRGKEIAMVFQDPASALDPVYSIGAQIEEAIAAHEEVEPGEAEQRSVALLSALGVPSPQLRHDELPHRLSGGLKQRAMIAAALAANPRLLIADEPTTALDLTIQAQILDLLGEERRRRQMGLLLISHDLAVVRQTCDRVVVMYAGRAVEEGPVAEVFARPLHPYTALLLAARVTAETPPRTPLSTVPGVVPSPAALPSGCAFRDRCPSASPACAAEPPEVRGAAGHRAFCVHPRGGSA
ncbi:MAG: dipeptide/oligopeptide/nickel ABC transporter permease/ATP-binding protein [Myxococcota bacterium]